MNYPKVLTPGLRMPNQYNGYSVSQGANRFHGASVQHPATVSPAFRPKTVQAKSNPTFGYSAGYQNPMAHQNKTAINQAAVNPMINSGSIQHQRIINGTRHSVGFQQNSSVHPLGANTSSPPFIHGPNHIGVHANPAKAIQAKQLTTIANHATTSSMNSLHNRQGIPRSGANSLIQSPKTPAPHHLPMPVNNGHRNNNTVQPLLTGLIVGGLALAGAAAAYRFGIRRTGMARSSQVNTYSREVAGIHRNWDTLTPNARRNQLVAAANRRLGVANVPHVGVDNGADMTASNHGAFSHQNWRMRLNPVHFQTDNISRDQFSDLADTVYHEARHSEQIYRVARRMAGQGHGVDHIRDTTGIPENIARQAVRNPINRFSLSRYRFETDRWHRSLFGADREERNHLLMGRHVNEVLTGHHRDMITMYRDEINFYRPQFRNAVDNIRRNPLTEQETTQLGEFSQHRQRLDKSAEDYKTQLQSLMRRYRGPLLHQRDLRGWHRDMTEANTHMQEAATNLQEHFQELGTVINANRGTYEDYRHLPEEADAWSVGGRVARRVGRELNPRR